MADGERDMIALESEQHKTDLVVSQHISGFLQINFTIVNSHEF